MEEFLSALEAWLAEATERDPEHQAPYRIKATRARLATALDRLIAERVEAELRKQGKR